MFPNENPSALILLRKKSKITSFKSLSLVKSALKTKKVGHTGTLDSFAQGLLVVLTGNLTRLVPHITNFSKTYIAEISFGFQTDTLDPTGKIVKTSDFPKFCDLQKSIKKFTGKIEQIPPEYSAIRISGKRASDLKRSGKDFSLKPRSIEIFENEIISYDEKTGKAKLKIKCSKGTYIRALARDLASDCNTVSHLSSLVRTNVGPFSLLDFDNDTQEMKIFWMDENLSKKCGFFPLILKSEDENLFSNGCKIKKTMFEQNSQNLIEEKCKTLKKIDDFIEFSVFYADKNFAGIIKAQKDQFLYGFVVKKSDYKSEKC